MKKMTVKREMHILDKAPLDYFNKDRENHIEKEAWEFLRKKLIIKNKKKKYKIYNCNDYISKLQDAIMKASGPYMSRSILVNTLNSL